MTQVYQGGNLNLTIWQTADYKQQFAYQDAQGQPIDLSAYNDAELLFKDATEQTLYASASTANGEITIDGPNGIVTLNIPTSKMELIVANGTFSLKLINTAPNPNDELPFLYGLTVIAVRKVP